MRIILEFPSWKDENLSGNTNHWLSRLRHTRNASYRQTSEHIMPRFFGDAMSEEMMK